MRYVAAILLVLSFNAGAADWTRADTTREAVYLMFHVADWAQTRNIARNGNKCFTSELQNCFEKNPILGKHPSAQKVNAYFLLTGAAHYLTARYAPEILNLSPAWRSAFQYVTIGMEANQVHENLQIGIGVEF